MVRCLDINMQSTHAPFNWTCSHSNTMTGNKTGIDWGLLALINKAVIISSGPGCDCDDLMFRDIFFKWLTHEFQ